MSSATQKLNYKARYKTPFFSHNESQEITPQTFPMPQGQMPPMNEYQGWVPFTYGQNHLCTKGL